ncbi:hypothetical protein [Pelagibius sp.]
MIHLKRSPARKSKPERATIIVNKKTYGETSYPRLGRSPSRSPDGVAGQQFREFTMANHMMFWRSAGLDEAIRSNLSPVAKNRQFRKASWIRHTAAETAAFERSLTKPGTSPWQKVRLPLH